MFTKLYSWCTSLGRKIAEGGSNTDFADYYRAYFEDTAVCSTIFWIAIAIGAVFALLFYFGICNYVFNLAKRWVWCLVMVLVFVISLCVTRPIIVGRDAPNPELSTGVFYSSYITEQEKLDGTDDNYAREEITQIASDFREQFKWKSAITRDSLPFEMGMANGAYAIVVFFVLSLLIKKQTRHGASIPF